MGEVILLLSFITFCLCNALYRKATSLVPKCNLFYKFLYDAVREPASKYKDLLDCRLRITTRIDYKISVLILAAVSSSPPPPLICTISADVYVIIGENKESIVPRRMGPRHRETVAFRTSLEIDRCSVRRFAFRFDFHRHTTYGSVANVRSNNLRQRSRRW